MNPKFSYGENINAKIPIKWLNMMVICDFTQSYDYRENDNLSRHLSKY